MLPCRRLDCNIRRIIFSQRSYMETKGWDVFRSLPPETDSSSENIQKWLSY